LAVQLHLIRPRTGEKVRSLAEIVDLTTRAAHEQELFPPADWVFIEWLAKQHPTSGGEEDRLVLSDIELLHWLARWGNTGRLELASSNGGEPSRLEFNGVLAEITPCLENGDRELSFTPHLTIPSGAHYPLEQVQFFADQPPLALVGSTFYLLRNAPPPELIECWTRQTSVPVRKLSHRLLLHLRKTHSDNGVDWEQLCVSHVGVPQFVFEMLDETIRLRLRAKSEHDQGLWIWTGLEWQKASGATKASRPEILDDPRLEPATLWLRKLDWFTPEPGLWVGDATEVFLESLAAVWRTVLARLSTRQPCIPTPILQPAPTPAAPHS
jgi:hypothetical protein